MADSAGLSRLEAGDLFLTDGGLETSLIFHQGFDLPAFASFDVLKDEAGVEALRTYFAPFLAIARESEAGFILDTATWRASRDWGAEIGYSAEEVRRANRHAVELAEELRAGDEIPIVINGAIGPRADAYYPDSFMSAEEAERYHAEQIETLREAGVDMVSAITLTYPEEATGIVRAAAKAGLPVVVSFTVETDGRLPNGQPLRAAIEQVDAETDGAAAYFMINCAHPQHFAGELEEDGSWLERIRGIRANASTKSHAELDEAEELDDGDPVELAAAYRGLKPRLPKVNVLGGCCGTDHRHIGEICKAWPRVAGAG
jgi:S-methylmethionine-dependent homocysteine/selenocysteine methylase